MLKHRLMADDYRRIELITGEARRRYFIQTRRGCRKRQVRDRVLTCVARRDTSCNVPYRLVGTETWRHENVAGIVMNVDTILPSSSAVVQLTGCHSSGVGTAVRSRSAGRVRDQQVCELLRTIQGGGNRVPPMLTCAGSHYMGRVSADDRIDPRAH